MRKNLRPSIESLEGKNLLSGTLPVSPPIIVIDPPVLSPGHNQTQPPNNNPHGPILISPPVYY